MGLSTFSKTSIWILVFLSLAACSRPVTGEMKLDTHWHFRQAGGGTWLEASVPGTVHDDLLHQGLIPDPFIGRNEQLVQWVEKVDWEYRCLFKVPKALLNKDRIVLEFEGLDTYAEVFLNGEKILEADNMFLGWEVNVKELLKSGENELRVYFHSPVKKGMEKLQQLDYLLPAENEQAPLGERTNVFTRKAPFHYGWDWGPRLVTSGIWRPVRLKAWSHAQITDPYLLTQSLENDLATLKMDVMLHLEQAGDYTLITRMDGIEAARLPLPDLTTGTFPVEQTISLTDPKVWWSNGLGEPYLYDVEFILEKEGKAVDTHRLSFGIRTLRLVQEPDVAGHSFYFELNGVPVFMKGANVIPPEPLTPRLTRESYERLIGDAVAAHMNMVRVWGGAIYPDNEFYQVCDENGILVWQDFMFACALQPGDEGHLENIRKEAEYNVKRLRNHASLALWCGNNENLHGWHHWGWNEAYSPEVTAFLWRTYERIFYEILAEAVSKYDPKTHYHPSSPSSVGNTLADRRSGDEHDWTVYFQQALFSNYERNVPRFVSEYGLQSFPAMETIRYYTDQDSLFLDAPILDHRQRSRMEWKEPGFSGNQMMEWYAEQYFPKTHSFEELAYVSQLVQALAYKTALESHRRHMPHCMGSLYWQLNDCWPTQSWSTVDYFRRWKASHYAARNANEAVIASIALEEDTLKVYVVSDLLKAFPARLQMSFINLSGELLKEITLDPDVQPNQSQVVFESSIQSLFPAPNDEWILHTRLTGEGIDHENQFVPRLPKEMELPPASLQYRLSQAGDEYLLELRSTALIKGLSIDTGLEARHLSDNYFDLLPGIPKIIRITGKKAPGRLAFNSFNAIRAGVPQESTSLE